VALALAVGVSCPSAADLPLAGPDLRTFRDHTTWRYPPDARVDLRQAPPSRGSLAAVSFNVGGVKVIQGDDSCVSTVRGTQGVGWGLRMDEGRQDLSRLTRQVIEEEGDLFDFITVFPTFQDLLNPGFAYFSLIRNADQGIGLSPVDQGTLFGSPGRLQGFLNMNDPAAYTRLDGLSISDPGSFAHAILAHEVGHRWLAFAKVRKAGFMGGQVSAALLGRDRAHWSALLHTGPADVEATPYVSVLDGAAWKDNGDGSYTLVDTFSDPDFGISARARYTPLDLYLMGLAPVWEVPPFFLVDGATLDGQAVAPDARLWPGDRVRGNRVDFLVEDVVSALGARLPDHQAAPRAFTMAVVVLTPPGQSAEEAGPVVEAVDAFRQVWERRFHAWTGGRASLCTSITGACDGAHVVVRAVTVTETSGDGMATPGERLAVEVRVANQGEQVSAAGEVVLVARGGVVEPAEVPLLPLAVGEERVLWAQVTPEAGFPCGTDLEVRAVVRLGATQSVPGTGHVTVGTRVVARLSGEDATGWRVNPDGTDTATAGQWAAGLPRRTDGRGLGAARVVLQPGQDAPDLGAAAFLTDPGPEDLAPTETNTTDVDDGVTTLESPPLPLDGLQDPVLSSWVWHAAVVVHPADGRLSEAAGDDLVVSVSTGGPFQEVARWAGTPGVWQSHAVRLAEVPGGWRTGAPLRVR
jgi:hypothetical protein